MVTLTAVSAEPLLNDVEAAAILGVKPQTLRIWRSTGRYPVPFIRVGRLVKYRRADLEKWLGSRTVTSTGEARAAGL